MALETYNLTFKVKVEKWDYDGDYFTEMSIKTTDDGLLAYSKLDCKSGPSRPFTTSGERDKYIRNMFRKLYFYPFEGDKVFPDCEDIK
jgi:hypothetical protein